MTSSHVAVAARDRDTLLYVCPGFGVGGAEVRTAQIITFLGSRYRHCILPLNGNTDARDRIERDIPVTWVAGGRPAGSLKTTGRLLHLIWQHKPDLVLTFNWGAIDAVVATALSRCCPVIHTEDGHNSDEADSPKRRRVLYRRLALRHAFRVIAPSLQLVRTMRDQWRLPEDKICYLPNGIDTERFRPQPLERDARPIIVGTVGSLTSVKRQDRLIDVCASLAKSLALKLVIVGDGPERGRLEQQVAAYGFGPWVEFTGYRVDTHLLYPRFDIFALSSVTEQMPLAALEAMATGLPIVSTNVGDIKQLVSRGNKPFIVDTMREFGAAISRLAQDPSLRIELGKANRARCVDAFSLRDMCTTYEQLYKSAIECHRGGIELR